jgi:membrane-associated phospholipid phosphatase
MKAAVITKSMPYPSRQVVAAVITGSVLALLCVFTVDQTLSLYFKQPELLSLWLKARSITNVALSEYYFVISLALFVFFKWVKPQSSRWREWARDSFFALVGSGVLVHIVKFTFGRQRPHLSEDFNPRVFHPFTTDWNYHSFASGHTQVMFTVATMLTLAFPKGKWGFYLLATLISFTRVIIHDHFLSDIIGGAVIGYVGAVTSVYWIHRRLRRSSQRNSTALSANR